jgi:hypothetical protein
LAFTRHFWQHFCATFKQKSRNLAASHFGGFARQFWRFCPPKLAKLGSFCLYSFAKCLGKCKFQWFCFISRSEIKKTIDFWQKVNANLQYFTSASFI